MYGGINVKNEIFSRLRKKISFLICNFAPAFGIMRLKQVKILYGMNAIVNITTQAFVRSQRRFEQSSYVHPFGTPRTTKGIGLPRHQEHSCFFRAS